MPRAQRVFDRVAEAFLGATTLRPAGTPAAGGASHRSTGPAAPRAGPAPDAKPLAPVDGVASEPAEGLIADEGGMEAAAEPLAPWPDAPPPGGPGGSTRPRQASGAPALASPGGVAIRRSVVVIPAYNEEQTLPQVIAAARAVPEVDEVVVVSDGSTDATPAVARANGAICIELQQNVGKGGAMKAGIDRADADVYVFLDADLIGVQPEHVRALLLPVLESQAEVVIAQLDGGRVATDLAQVVAPNLSGQRTVTRRVLQGMSGLEATRFGVEIAMKRYIKRQGIPVLRVPLDITHRTKEEKMGLLRGFLARMRMYWETVKYVGE